MVSRETSILGQLLLCTDLDRTLLPNGPQPESAQARPLFCRLAAHPAVTLAYVSGRDFRLVEQAIEEFHIPRPDYLIGDVGTTIYRRGDTRWQPIAAWHRYIGEGWQEGIGSDLAAMLQTIPGLTLQEAGKQGPHKVSFYLDAGRPLAETSAVIRQKLISWQCHAKLVSSRDEAGVGLIDILPVRADKYQAICFLLEWLKVDRSEVVFAGDSGNDLDVLASELASVLVANSTADVQQQAIKRATANGNSDTLYIARGNFLGLNGNYSGGILEGVAHFKAEFTPLLQAAHEALAGAAKTRTRE